MAEDPVGNFRGEELIPDSSNPELLNPVVASEIKDGSSNQRATVESSGGLRVVMASGTIINTNTQGSSLPSGTNVLGAVYDANSAWVAYWGVTGTHALVNSSGTLVNLTDVPPTGMRVVLTDLLIGAGGTANVVTLLEETSGFILGAFYVNNYAPFMFSPRSKFKLPTAGKRLVARSNTSNTINVLVGYYFE